MDDIQNEKTTVIDFQEEQSEIKRSNYRPDCKDESSKV